MPFLLVLADESAVNGLLLRVCRLHIFQDFFHQVPASVRRAGGYGVRGSPVGHDGTLSGSHVEGQGGTDTPLLDGVVQRLFLAVSLGGRRGNAGSVRHLARAVTSPRRPGWRRRRRPGRPGRSYAGWAAFGLDSRPGRKYGFGLGASTIALVLGFD